MCWHTRYSAGKALKHLGPWSHMKGEMCHVPRCKWASGSRKHQTLLLGNFLGKNEAKELPVAPGNLMLSENHSFFNFFLYLLSLLFPKKAERLKQHGPKPRIPSMLTTFLSLHERNPPLQDLHSPSGAQTSAAQGEAPPGAMDQCWQLRLGCRQSPDPCPLPLSLTVCFC